MPSVSKVKTATAGLIKRIKRIMELQDKTKDELIELLKKANRRVKRNNESWKRKAKYWRGAFVNACQNQMRDNDAYRKRINELERRFGYKAQEYMGSVIIPPHIPMPEPQVKPRRDFDKEPYTMDEVVRRLSPHGDRAGEWYCTSRQPKLAWRIDMVDTEGLIVRKLVHDMKEHTISKAPEIYKPETVEQLAKKIIDYNFRFLADFDRKEWD